MAKNQKAFIDPNRCDRSPGCPAKKVCPVGAITQKQEGKGLLGFPKMGPSQVEPTKCIGCGKCVDVCPAKAIKLA